MSKEFRKLRRNVDEMASLVSFLSDMGIELEFDPDAHESVFGLSAHSPDGETSINITLCYDSHLSFSLSTDEDADFEGRASVYSDKDMCGWFSLCMQEDNIWTSSTGKDPCVKKKLTNREAYAMIRKMAEYYKRTCTATAETDPPPN